MLEYSLKDYTITNTNTASSDIMNLSGGNADIYLNNSLTRGYLIDFKIFFVSSIELLYETMTSSSISNVFDDKKLWII